MKKQMIYIIILVAFIIFIITLLIIELTKSNESIGILTDKMADVQYSYNEERVVIDGDKASFEGDNETIATINYILMFYINGEIIKINAGTFSAKVSIAYNNDAAYKELMSNHSEPPFYTYSKIDEEYLIKTTKIFNKLIDLTPTSSIKVEIR